MARLALFLPNLQNGGAERVALSLAGDFIAHGHEVDIVLARATGELLSHVPSAAKLFDLRAVRFRNSLRPLIRYLRERRPAALLAFMWPLTTISIVAARLSGTSPRICVSNHSILSNQYRDSPIAMSFLRWTTRLLYPLADARICVSQGVAADLSKISGLSPEQFTTIYNPVPRPPESLTATEEVERLWGDAAQRILSVGMLKPAKNYELLIRAFSLLARNASAKLIIIGEGELRARLEKLIEELGLTGRVLLPGFVKDPWPYYASADLFVLSSDREGFSLVIAEALLAGLRVVSTDCECGPREILDDGRLGRLVPVGDAVLLAEAMSAALEEQHDGHAGREQALRITQGSAERYLALMLGTPETDLALADR